MLAQSMKDSTECKIRVTRCTEDRRCNAGHVLADGSRSPDRADFTIGIRSYNQETIVALCAAHARELRAALGEVNAALISAAPELLAACQRVLGEVPYRDGHTTACRANVGETCDCWLGPMRGAVARAEGGAV